jgi:hypothetical protein
MLSVQNPELALIAKCRYAECCYAECRGALWIRNLRKFPILCNKLAYLLL